MSGYKTEKRAAKVGERILITNAYITADQYRNGDILEVDKVGVYGREGNVNVKGFVIYVAEDEYEVIIEEDDKMVEQSTIKLTMPDGTIIEGTAEELAKLQQLTGGESDESETEEDDAPTEETFDKPAKVGDTIRITDAYATGGVYKDGDILTVDMIDYDNEVVGVEGIAGRRYISDEEFEIVGRKSKSLSVGDYAKVVGDTYRGDIKEGTFVKITEDKDYVDDYKIELPDGTDYDYAKEESLLHVDEADVPSDKPALYDVREGDVLFIDAGDAADEYPLHGFSNGDKVEVSSLTPLHENEGVIEVKGGIYGGGYPRLDQLREATAEEFSEGNSVRIRVEGSTEKGRAGVSNDEVGEIKRINDYVRINFESYRNGRFTWNGKANELRLVSQGVTGKITEEPSIKEGDIVMMSKDTCVFPKGTIGEVIAEEGDGVPRVRAVKYGNIEEWYETDDELTLVARKEDRCDV